MGDDAGAIFSFHRSSSYPDVTQNGVLLTVGDGSPWYAAQPIRLLKLPPVIPRSYPSLFLFHSSYLI